MAENTQENSRPNMYHEYETDKTLELEGVWVQDIRPGLHVKVARLGNPKYREIYQRKAKPFRQQIERGTLSLEIQNELAVYAVARTILLDWAGEACVDREGDPLPNTVEAKERVLTDLPDFREDVIFISREAEAFKLEQVDEAEKNSLGSSDGPSGGQDSNPTGKGASSDA